MVVVTTSRGPWKICVDPECPAKAEAAEKKAAKEAAGTPAAPGARPSPRSARVVRVSASAARCPRPARSTA